MKIVHFRKFPFFRLTVPFGLGIVFYHYAGHLVQIDWLLLFVLIATYLYLAWQNSYRFSALLSILAMSIVFIFGFFRLQEYRLDTEPTHLLHKDSTIMAYESVVIEPPSLKARSVNLILEIRKALIGESWVKVSGRVNAYAAPEAAEWLQYGDVIVANGRPQLTTPPSNPGEFDFANYLVYNNIFHQHFIGNDFQKVGESVPNWFMAQSIRLRKRCQTKLEKHLTNPEVKSVMLAIVLGIKDELDNDLQSAYSASGAMHVLAVSGLHVGIIYGIILLVFKHLKLAEHKGRWTMAIVSILALWTYAFVTGLSPSVMRAVTMFSFMALSKALNRNSNIYNTLAASAFVLLWFNPYLIMSVGFQLSYLAVFGIVYLQPKFYRLFTFPNGLLDKVWAITCVSLAAQIATAPLSMLYFHQFPSYFLISNLFIIPAAFIMLLMGLSMLALSSVPLISTGLAWLIDLFVNSINALVYWVRDLPGSALEGIRLTTPETWLIYSVVICFILLFERKRITYLISAMGTACIFVFSQIYSQSSYASSSALRVLNVSNSSVVDFRFGRESRLFADSTFLVDDNRRRFHLEPGRLLAGSNLRPDKDELNLTSAEFLGNPLVSFEGELFLFLKKPLAEIQLRHGPLSVDYLVLSHNAVRDLKVVTEKFAFKSLIIDASNTAGMTRRLVNQAKALDLEVHAVRQDGYFEKLWQE